MPTLGHFEKQNARRRKSEPAGLFLNLVFKNINDEDKIKTSRLCTERAIWATIKEEAENRAKQIPQVA